jgi:SAM-dependent methyltransferase
VSRAHLAFWRELAREAAPRRILELGAGLGRITAALDRVAPAVGVDLSLEMLAARARAPGRGGPALSPRTSGGPSRAALRPDRRARRPDLARDVAAGADRDPPRAAAAR